MNKVNIFILAAGLGERLRPITNIIPKPLIPVLGTPAIQHVIDRVSILPFKKIGINLHYRKNALEAWLDQSYSKDNIVFFLEDKILGTGGALKNAEHFLREGPFLVHNADIVSDINLKDLLKYHFSSDHIATLAIHDYPRFNSLVIDEMGGLKCVSRDQKIDMKKWAFTGIAVYNAEFLEFLPEGVSSVVDAWWSAIHAGRKVGTFDVTGCSWNDIGSPSAYASAVFDALRAEGEVVWIHPSLRSCDTVTLQEYIVIEKDCSIDKGTTLRNCILLPGSDTSRYSNVLTGGEGRAAVFENCIIGRDFKIELDIGDIPALAGEQGKQLIGTGGSERRYYRIRKGGTSEVLMQCTAEDPDFDRQIEYTRFFLKCSVPVPGLIRVIPEEMQAVFEDAGDISVYSYMKCPRSGEEIERIYKNVLDALSLIHVKATEHVAECPMLENRIFDYDYFRWETDYFMERYVRDIQGIRPEDKKTVLQELHDLALKADSLTKNVIHRDFQSQNIMILNGREIRIIDYQGARMGPPAYDVASCLWDPYFRLDDELRERLLEYYLDKMSTLYGSTLLVDEFREGLTVCRLQRHMQALGAYGYLSSVRGKKYFMKYMPEGLRLLKEDVSSAKDEYPRLYNLIMTLEGS